MDIDTFEEKYLKVIKVCARLAGIWPDQSYRSKYILRAITLILFVTCFLTQIARVVFFFELDIIIEQLSFLSAAAGIMIKQWNYIIYATEYEMFLNCIRRDWSMNRVKGEVDIMTKYAERGAFLTSFYLVNCIFCFTFFLQTPLTPRILDILLPKNESRDVGLIYPAYYPIDEQKYQMLILVHMVCVIVVVFYVYVASDTSYMFIVQHGCGQLAVAGYRFQQSIQESIVNKEKNARGDECYRRVRHAIRGHQYALKYLRAIENTYIVYLFIIVGFVMLCLSVTLVKVSTMEFSVDLTKHCIFVLIQLVHIFYLSIQGQFVIDANEEIANSMYNAMWYESDKRTQLLFVLALRSCLSPPHLTAGGLITQNLRNFSEIIKTSVSYFTVLKST